MNQSSSLIRAPRDVRGVALLITLSAVVLITVLILAFFSNSQLNRQISYSNTNTVKADQLARSALEIVTGQIREEIADPSYSSTNNGGNSAYPIFYRPLAASNAVPQKVGISGALTTNLFKVSANSSAIDPGSNGRTMGSSILISQSSLNGRYLSEDRWFGSGGPDLGTNDTLPTWVYVTRGGVQTPVLTDAANPSKTGYVMGRFAYTVYDIGGLMDANVAGYPTVAATVAPFKSSLAFADVGGALGITGLAAWRNVSTGTDTNTFMEWGAGLPPASGATNSGAMTAAASGHLSADAGDNVFFSRHDLLLAAQGSIAGLTTAQAGQLTHFSRALNAPSWVPAITSTTNPDLTGVRFQASATITHYDITHYDDTGTATTYPVLAGDPLIQRRFSLAKVGWISASGAKAGISAAAIQACFGLKWTSLPVGGVTTPCWEYVGASGSTIQSGIETLSQIAAENREPNFFELLKAGMLAGSVGKASDNVFMMEADQKALEASGDFQIFQIGLNIIDCAGADNYPTTVAYADPVGGGAPVFAHGIKDLPYLYATIFQLFYNESYVNANSNQINFFSMVFVPELFNPHAAGVSFSSGPSNIRVRIAGGAGTNAYGQLIPSGTLFLNQTLTLNLSDPSGTKAITVPSSVLEDFRAAMKPVRHGEATSSTTLSTLVGSSLVDSADSDVDAFLYYTYPGPPVSYSTSGVTQVNMRAEFSNLLMVLEYQDAANPSIWHVYDTMGGNESFLATGTGILSSKTAACQPLFAPSILPITSGSRVNNSVISGGGFFKLDPRTTRFSGSWANSLSGTITAPVSGSFAGVSQDASPPFGPRLGGAYYPGAWLLGNKTGWVGSSYANNVQDVDGVVRPADGWLGGGANFFSNVAATGNSTGRPVILHRPYRSVAELGYVFRAAPWKTINFFDDTSADGALLDIFSVSDQPRVVAGQIDLNSPQAEMQQALLSGTAQSYDGTSQLSSSLGSSMAAAYQTFANSSGTPTTSMPVNPGELPSFMPSAPLGGAYATAANPIKYCRESVMRALTSGTQTRTWNLLIDVVAQVGRFQSGAIPTSLANFIVEGEKRYWLSIAIDRYTGKVIDEQLEPVNE